MHVELAGEHPLGLGASEVSIDGIELNAQLATDGAADSGRLEKARRQFSLVGAQLAQFRDRSPHDLERLDLKQRRALGERELSHPIERIVVVETSLAPGTSHRAAGTYTKADDHEKGAQVSAVVMHRCPTYQAMGLETALLRTARALEWRAPRGVRFLHSGLLKNSDPPVCSP